MVRPRRSRKRQTPRKAGGANKVLPLNKSILLGIQHVLAMFAGNITVPIIIAAIFGQTTEEKIFFNTDGLICCWSSNNYTNSRL